MAEYLAPGVYLRPIPEPRRDVRLVRTDVTGFVGYAERGPLVSDNMALRDIKRLPMRITSWKEFRTNFGGFIPNGHLAYAVKGFFENGGTTVYIVRVAATRAAEDKRPRAASLLVPAGAPNAPLGIPLALHNDAHAGDRRLVVQNIPGATIGTRITIESGGITELHMVVGRHNNALVLASSLSTDHTAADARIAQFATGLLIEARSKGNWGNRIRVVVTPLEVSPHPQLGDTFSSFSLRLVLDPGPDTSAPVEEEYYNRLSLISDTTNPASAFNAERRVNLFSNLVRVSITGSLFFAGSGAFGTPQYLEGGQEGLSAVTVDDVCGGPEDLRGLRLLEEVEEIGILCAPDAVFAYSAPTPPPAPSHDPCEPPPKPAPRPDRIAADPTALPAAVDPATIYGNMIGQCERLRDRVAIVDTPAQLRGARPLLAWRQAYATRYAALYYPWLEVPDALDALGGSRAVPPCGHVAGIYAYTDNAFGVQRPPANAELAFVTGVADPIDSHAQENLNPFDINAIRSFPGRGIRIWGARSLAHPSEADWRFIHVRRLMSMIEKSVEKSMQWAAFEPNDFPVRRTLTHSLNVFLEAIWRRGGMKGDQPSEGFFVKCDETNNSQTVIDAGRLVCRIGIAPTAPMEFIVFEIRQGGAQTDLLER